MSIQLSAEHSATLRQETVVSVAINALIPATVIWILDVTPPQQLIGPDTILKALVPASGVATLLMTVVLTFIVRARIAGGAVPALAPSAIRQGFYRFIPRPLVLRAPFLGLTSVVLLVPPVFGLVAIIDILPLTKFGALILNIAFGTLVGLAMTRFVVLPALADGASR